MDGPVLGAIITASVALVVAVGGAARSVLQATLDRRYERRRVFLIQAQDAMLVLREELAAHGVALHEQVSGGSPTVAGVSSLGIDGPDPAATTATPTVTDQRGQPGPAPASASFVMAVPAAEEAAFAEVNELIRQALGSLRGTVPRGRRRAASR